MMFWTSSCVSVLEVRAFGQVLANEPVGVLVEPALPGMAGVSEVAIGVEHLGDDLMVEELLAVVRVGEHVDKAGMGVVAAKPPPGCARPPD